MTDRSFVHTNCKKFDLSMNTVTAIFSHEIWLELLIQLAAKIYSNDHSLVTLYVTVA